MIPSQLLSDSTAFPTYSPSLYTLSFWTHYVQFVLSKYFGVWDLPWCVVNLPGVTTLKKTECPFPKSYQSPMDPQLRVRLPAHLPSSCWNFVCLEIIRVLCMLSQPPWVQMDNGPAMSGQLFLCCRPQLLAPTVFPPSLPQWFLSFVERAAHTLLFRHFLCIRHFDSSIFQLAVSMSFGTSLMMSDRALDVTISAHQRVKCQRFVCGTNDYWGDIMSTEPFTPRSCFSLAIPVPASFQENKSTWGNGRS